MKRMLIGLTLCLVALAFIGGSEAKSSSTPNALGELNRVVDLTLSKRLAGLRP